MTTIYKYIKRVLAIHNRRVKRRNKKKRQYRAALFIQLHFKNLLRAKFGKHPRENRALMK